MAALPGSDNADILRLLGYERIDRVISICEVQEGDLAEFFGKLVNAKFYAAFKGENSEGIIWFNKLTEKWCCDAWKNGKYRETLMDVDLRTLLTLVCEIYENPGAEAK
jgi:hypothetical protein